MNLEYVTEGDEEVRLDLSIDGLVVVGFEPSCSCTLFASVQIIGVQSELLHDTLSLQREQIVQKHSNSKYESKKHRLCGKR